MTEQITEPLKVAEPKKTEAKPTIDVESLVSELERAGITNAGELEGKLRASKETGRLAQLLGDERNARSNLEARLKELEARPATQSFEHMDYNTDKPIDVSAEIERSVEKVFTKREQQQLKAQEENLKKWNFINNDQDYSLVKEVWESKLKDPNFSFKIQYGMVDPVKEYTDTVRGYYKTLLQKSHETITTMRGAGKVAPPHMETGERSSANMVSETPSGTDAQKKRAELKAKTEKGHILSQEEEIELIDTIFGSKTPL